jgi:hypothetical protein
MFAVLKRSAQSWSTLPLSLLQHPWLNIDYKVRIPQIQLSSRRLFWFWITKFLGRASLTSQVVNSSGTCTEVLLINRASGDAAIAKGDSAPVSKMKAIHIYCLLFTDCGLWPILLLRFTTSRRAV